MYGLFLQNYINLLNIIFCEPIVLTLDEIMKVLLAAILKTNIFYMPNIIYIPNPIHFIYIDLKNLSIYSIGQGIYLLFGHKIDKLLKLYFQIYNIPLFSIKLCNIWHVQGWMSLLLSVTSMRPIHQQSDGDRLAEIHPLTALVFPLVNLVTLVHAIFP